MEEKGSRKGRRRRKSREALVDLSSDPVGGAAEKKAEPSRVLLDVIRDGDPNAGGYRSLVNHDKHKKSWKVFKDRLRLKQASQAWISALPDEGRRHPLQLLPPEAAAEEEEESGSGEEEPRRAALRPQLSRLTSFQPPEPMRDDVPISDPPLQGARRPQMMRRNSSRLGPSNSIRQRDDPGPRVRFADQLAAEKEQIQRVVSSVQAYRESEEEEEEGNADAGGGGGGEPVKMSLMDLLGDTDEQMGWASYMAELEDSDEDGEEDEDAEEQTCCICMVRHKGADSTLCGHTFCRLCSKELMVSRGNCPRCNGFVLEILEIF